MRKEDLEQFSRRRPFEPFLIRLVDGQIFQFNHPEELIIGRTAISTLDDEENFVLINLSLISTAKPVNGQGKKRR